MGALKSGAFPVELNGKEYGLLFSLNALDEVQEKFGGYDKLSEVFNKDNPNADYHASVAWGWDKKSPLNTGEKSYDVGNIYQYYAYSLAALMAGGDCSDGANCGARAVLCNAYPWDVNTSFGARGACDSL